MADQDKNFSPDHREYWLGSKGSRTITYKIPDQRFCCDGVCQGVEHTCTDCCQNSDADKMQKTSTMEYSGPDRLVCWIINNEPVTRVVDSFPEDEVPERPMPVNYTAVTIDATASDENAVRVALLWGGLPPIRYMEIDNCCPEIPNRIIADPTDIREVYDKWKVLEDCIDLETMVWKPLEYRIEEEAKSMTDDEMRKIRDGLLFPTDSKIADDMPADIKQEWLDYRQLLRDLPEITKDCPNYMICFPMPPDEPDLNDLFETKDGDDNVTKAIRISERTADDQWIVDNQLPDCLK